MNEILVIGKPNPEALQYLLESVLNYLLNQQEKQDKPLTVEAPVLVLSE
jgi:hypothetical protein